MPTEYDIKTEYDASLYDLIPIGDTTMKLRPVPKTNNQFYWWIDEWIDDPNSDGGAGKEIVIRYISLFDISRRDLIPSPYNGLLADVLKSGIRSNYVSTDNELAAMPRTPEELEERRARLIELADGQAAMYEAIFIAACISPKLDEQSVRDVPYPALEQLFEFLMRSLNRAKNFFRQ